MRDIRECLIRARSGLILTYDERNSVTAYLHRSLITDGLIVIGVLVAAGAVIAWAGGFCV